MANETFRDIYCLHLVGRKWKKRPVLAFSLNDINISVFPVTIRYEGKSKAITAKYFKVNYLSEAGFDKQSYVDTGTLINLPVSVIDSKKPIGELSVDDKKLLLEFLIK